MHKSPPFFVPFILLPLFTFAACSSSANPSAAIPLTDAAYITQDQNPYQNGRILTAYTSNASYAAFLSYDTMTSVPLCNKPNYTHSDSSCIAFACLDTDSSPLHFVYEDALYWFTSDYETVSDGSGGTAPKVSSALKKADLTTGEIKTALTIDGLFAEASTAYRDGDTLYITIYHAERGHASDGGRHMAGECQFRRTVSLRHRPLRRLRRKSGASQ